MFEDLKIKLEQEILPILTQENLELVDFRMGMYGKTINIRVFADKPSGGITIDQCSMINKTLIRIIDEQRLITSDYTVEVASPGLDWPLTTANDFKRVLHKNIRVHLAQAVEGKIEYTGRLEKIDENLKQIYIQVKDKEIMIDLSKINKSVQSMDI